MKLLFSLFVLVSCATSSSRQVDLEFANLPTPSVTLQHHKIHPAFVKKIYTAYKSEWGKPQIICSVGDKKIEMATEIMGNQIRSFIAFDYYTTDKNAICKLRLKRDDKFYEYDLAHFEITPYEYIVERVNVDKKHVELSPKNLARWQKEREIFKKVYEQSVRTLSFFTEKFELPLKSKMTSPYGTRRVFNNQKDSLHSGIDFRARIGTPIPAANRGLVVIADDFFFNGKTIMIDHGAGIFTMYCHLSELKAQVGEMVPKGEIIGLSGNTGRSSGPHLHWGVWVAGHWVNGFSLLEQGI